MHEEINRVTTLSSLREKAGLTQEALAAKLGVTDHTVRNWEKGRHEPKLTIKQVKALVDALGVSLKELPDVFADIGANNKTARSGGTGAIGSETMGGTNDLN